MTGTPTIPSTYLDRDDVVRDAARCALAAAQRCGAEIREIEDPHELEELSRLLSILWSGDTINRQMTTNLLKALAETGHYVAGSFVEGQIVGASVAFFAAPPTTNLHSHITGIAEGNAARSLGFALKLHQRAWALQRGADTISWTFDPLVRRNGYFNIGKLRAHVVEYLPNFYGEMQDRINAGDQSDRLMVSWDLLAPEVVLLCKGGPVATWDEESHIDRVLSVAADGSPRRSRWDRSRAVLAVPQDVEVMRLQDPLLAREWRLALRDVLGGALANGARIVGFWRSEGYVVDLGRTENE
jgi:predicted GNAT superfamily acetyltransferase